MDLTQLANLGEFIGGVAVLVTLIYLAVQVRQSAAAQRAAALVTAGDAMRSNIVAFSTFRQMVADESIGELWAKAQDDDDLTPAEKFRLQAVVNEVAWTAVAMIETFRATGNDEYVEAMPAMIALELGGRESSEAMPRYRTVRGAD